MCHMCIVQWSVGLFTSDTGKYTLCPAWFPFEYRYGIGFYVALVYQICGMVWSAWAFIALDTMTIGLFFHATAQVKRLAHNLQKVYEYESN